MNAAREAAQRPTHDSVMTYVRIVAAVMPRQAAITLALMLVGSVTAWAGLMLLVPLLGIVGVDLGQGVAGQIARSAEAVMTGLGLHPGLATVLVLYVLIVSGRAFLQRWQTLAGVELQEGLVLHLRHKLYRAVTNTRWVFYSRNRASDFLNTLTSQASRAGHAVLFLVMLVSSTLTGAVHLIVALMVSPGMTLVTGLSGSALMLLLRKRARRSRELGGALSTRSARLLAALTEHLGGMKTAKSYGAEERNIQVFSELTEQVAQVNRDTSRNDTGVTVGYQVGSVIILSVILYASIEVLQLATAEILLMLFVFSRLVPIFSGLQRTYQNLVFALPALTLVLRTIDACESENEERSDTPARLELRDAVRIEGASFRYVTDSEVHTISSLDLEIPARRTTAIVGPSGAGKSTIADLVLGLLTPDIGRVTIDGLPLTAERIRAWREQIGYVPQDTFLFHDTVRENVLWARPGASDNDLVEALRLAAADEFVRALPQGLNTVVGDRGVLLSGGERQRLALARALLRRPSLLVLDEATSALDSENEVRIQRAIEKLHGHMAILVITHRLSTIRGADTIHVLEAGRVVESGGWRTLIARGGRFTELCRAQGIVEDETINRAPAVAV